MNQARCLTSLMQRVLFRGVRRAPHSRALWLDSASLDIMSGEEMQGAEVVYDAYCAGGRP